MKKYTNKILLITLLLAALVMIVVCTVNLRKAFHNGEIMTKEEFVKSHSELDNPKIIVYSDSIQVVDNKTEIDE